MKKLIGLAGALLSISLLSGCATMFSGKTQEVSFNSRPAGAEVMVGSQTCITPCKLQLSKDKAYREITATKSGYQKEKMNVIASLDPWVFGNILNFGIGSIVDFVAGTYAKYEPEYLVQLEKK